MFNVKRFYAVLVARNLEFVRDYASLGWGLIYPIFIVVGFAFIFNHQQALYTVGTIGEDTISAPGLLGLGPELVDIAPQDDAENAVRKVERHGLDLLIEPAAGRYWINPDSPNGIVLEKILSAEGSVANLERVPVSGDALRYVDWALPGVLAMNIMFAALYGIGFVIVRYRKMGVLNLATWPMMLLGEVWFSMENAARWLQHIADGLPLTHMTRSARAIMLDAATFADVLPSLLYLAALTAALLVVGAALFRW